LEVEHMYYSIEIIEEKDDGTKEKEKVLGICE
jgi:hypothetical protein